MKHSVCFMNFVNYITIGCLLARLGRDFYCRTDYVFSAALRVYLPAASAFLKVINFKINELSSSR
ncbi:hypothetical protein DMI70_02160 [Escherichia coli]|nr:hypothetical protein [Escherichia coli]